MIQAPESYNGHEHFALKLGLTQQCSVKIPMRRTYTVFGNKTTYEQEGRHTFLKPIDYRTITVKSIYSRNASEQKPDMKRAGRSLCPKMSICSSKSHKSNLSGQKYRP